MKDDILVSQRGKRWAGERAVIERLQVYFRAMHIDPFTQDATGREHAKQYHSEHGASQAANDTPVIALLPQWYFDQAVG
ncbi:hypothetical protein D3C72_1683730 [compost metagenome]